jgi:hypothetical protein
MIKKNTSERRFNTAAARIMVSTRLPSDFFLSSQEKEIRESSVWSNRQENAEKQHIYDSLNKKEPLMFTFHRSNSDEKLKIRKSKYRLELPKLHAEGP